MKKWNIENLCMHAYIDHPENYNIYHGFNELFDSIEPWSRDGMTNAQIKKSVREAFNKSDDICFSYGYLWVLYYGHCFHFFETL